MPGQLSTRSAPLVARSIGEWRSPLLHVSFAAYGRRYFAFCSWFANLPPRRFQAFRLALVLAPRLALTFQLAAPESMSVPVFRLPPLSACQWALRSAPEEQVLTSQDPAGTCRYTGDRRQS